MGTNYYLHKNVCSHCNRGDEPIHIGKSSAGWCFSLHVILGEIESLEEWKKEFEKGQIRDEYGADVTVEEMLKTITERQCDKDWNRNWGNSGGYADEADFHRNNESERGPRGLLRHRIGRYCVAHGEGTYDLITGEFS